MCGIPQNHNGTDGQIKAKKLTVAQLKAQREWLAEGLAEHDEKIKAAELQEKAAEAENDALDRAEDIKTASES